jgi:hypothetical protein
LILESRETHKYAKQIKEIIPEYYLQYTVHKVTLESKNLNREFPISVELGIYVAAPATSKNIKLNIKVKFVPLLD